METRKIRMTLADKRISQKTLAEVSGYSQRTITRLLGADTIPDRAGLALMAALDRISKDGGAENEDC